MSETYNSQYYIDIFKWILERKLQNSVKKNSIIINNSRISLTSSTLFPIKPHQNQNRSKSSNTTKPHSQPFDNFKEKLMGIEKNQQGILSSRKNKAHLYNENLYEKVVIMKKKKADDLYEKRKILEIRQKSKEKKFAMMLQESQKSLHEKIEKNSKKREENLERVIQNKLRNEALLQFKLHEIANPSEGKA